MNQAPPHIDDEPLQRVRRLSEIVAVRVDEVARGNVASFFLYGPGGHGKSHAVTQQLEIAPGVGKWLHHNSRMTARAMVEILYEHQDCIHLFEDVEQIYQDATAAGILRSACAAVRGGQRRITYSTMRDKIEFVFRGGVVIVSNENLSNNPILGAVASRMRPLQWLLRPNEIVAIIRDAAAKGHTHRGHIIPADECQEVAEYVIAEMRSGKVDLRTYFEHALPSFWHWKQSKMPTVHWTDTVKTKIVGEPAIETRHDRIEREQVIACECYRDGGSTAARLELWTGRTAWNRQAFYNRISEAKRSGLFRLIAESPDPPSLTEPPSNNIDSLTDADLDLLVPEDVP